jgi:hypothetical protein
MPITQSRVPNHKIDQLFRERIPFTNYNQTIVATLDFRGIYSVRHHGVLMVELDIATQKVTDLNLRIYSQTTSVLQGRIIRNLVTRKDTMNLLDWYHNQGDKVSFRRLARLARVK